MPDTGNDLGEFRKADLSDNMEKEGNENVKDLVKKTTTVNVTNDYYITSSSPSSLFFFSHYYFCCSIFDFSSDCDVRTARRHCWRRKCF